MKGPFGDLGRFVSEYCDTCNNTGIYDYGNGNEPCRSVVHRATTGVPEQPEKALGAVKPIGGTDEPSVDTGHFDAGDLEPSLGVT